MASIEVSHISKRYGSIRALDDVSLDVREGEIFGLIKKKHLFYHWIKPYISLH